ncbi:hypothetical protein BJ742DRAFT_791652 [Cladochytrium replicatum]|nr:hypothetical protein BJ742DRAFT_791652 [Cladochytrium replicatum]
MITHVNQVMPATDPWRVKTGVKPVDMLAPILIQFFRDAADDEAIRFILYQLFGLATPVALFQGIESVRKGATNLHFVTGINTILMQLFGVSVTVPAMWIPTWLSNSTNPRLAPESVALVSAGVALTAVFSAGVVTTSEPQRSRAAAWFQIAPFLGWLVYAAAPFLGFKESTAGHQAAEHMFYLAAGLGATTHLAALSELLFKPGGFWKRVLSMMKLNPKAQTGRNSIGNFLFVDWAVLFAGVLYGVYVDEGKDAVLRVLALTPILGPGGALALGWARRESLLVGSA